MYQGTILVFRPRKGPTTLRSVNYRDMTLKDPMEFTTDNPCSTCAMRSDLATYCSDSERVMHRANANVGARSRRSKLRCRKLPLGAVRKWPPSFMKRVITARTLTKANEDMIGTVVESY